MAELMSSTANKPDSKTDSSNKEKAFKQTEQQRNINQLFFQVFQDSPRQVIKPAIETVIEGKEKSKQKSKSKSRSRSRQKNMNKQQKSGKNEDSSSRSDKYDREKNDRLKKNVHTEVRYRDNSPFIKQETYKKTKMCPQLQRGQCRKGSQCNFAHSQHELRGLPDFRKTKLCIAFKEGKCGKLSSECKYAHGQGQLRRMPKTSQQREQKRQRSPKKQKHHSKSINYSHVTTPPPPPPAYLGYIQPSYVSYGIPQTGINPNQYIQSRLPINLYQNNRVFSEYPPPQANNNLNFGNYGSYNPPTGGFYPPPPPPPNESYMHFYPPSPLTPPPGFGYPGTGPKPPM